MTHKHRVAVRGKAHTLGSCLQTGVEFCRCGSFRVAGVWIENGQPRSVAPAKRFFTLTEVAHHYGLSDRAMERLVAGGLLHGEKVCFQAKRRWLLTPQELGTVSFPNTAKAPQN
jgi:hypothetical protein